MTDPDLVFDASEFASRFERVRQRMSVAGIDVLLTHIPENIYYLTGYQTPGYYSYQCLAVPVEGAPALVVRLLESTNAAGLSYVRDFVGYTDIEDPADACVRALRERELLTGRVGLERDAWFLSPARYDRLKSAVGAADVVDGSGLIESVRVRKSPAELEAIRAAAVAANAAMARALEVIRPGVNENEIAAEVTATGIRHGSEYPSLPPFITSGPRSWLAHSTWSGRTVEDGDVVYLEISGVVKRYSAAVMRTAVAGRASSRHQRIAEVSIEGLEAAVETMRPGRTAGEVDRACRSVFERAGIAEHFLHRTGYSIGINFPPDWGEGHIASLRDGDGFVLESGMVFHAPPGVLILGEVGIGFSETVIVSEDGPERLNTVELKLFECGVGTDAVGVAT